MQIRVFQSADLEAMREMTAEAFDGVSIDQAIEHLTGEIHGHNWQWRKLRQLDTDVERDAAGIFVLEIEHEVAGYVTTWRDQEAGIGHIPHLVTAKKYRGQGYGRILLEHAMQHFRQHGLTHARIETLVQNEIGNHLYRDVGFREVAQQVHFIAEL